MKPVARAVVLLVALTAATLVWTSAVNAQDASALATSINPGDFVKDIDNRFFPMVPGTTFIYTGPTADGQEVLQISVTHAKKTVLGVETTVVSEIDMVDGILVEVAINWFAQDKLGNVWYFGEDSKLYQDGQVVSTEGSWEGGVIGASPGIIMEAHPRVGDIYQQEFAPGVAEDMAKVLSVTTTVSVPFGIFRHNCLKTREFSPLDPGINEFKFYAPRVGLILEIDNDGNRLALVGIIHP